MKKTFLVALAVALCAFAALGCTPSVEDLKSDYRKAGYNILPMIEEQLASYGADPDETEEAFYASKNGLVAYVVVFKSNGAAKKFAKVVSGGSSGGVRIARKGKAVIFGQKAAVDVVA